MSKKTLKKTPKKQKTKNKKTKKSSIYIVNLFIAIFLVVALAFLTNLILQNEDNKTEQENQIKNLKKEFLIQQQKQKEYKKQQAKIFKEKTKAMKIEYSEDIQSEETKDIKEEKSVFHYIEEKEIVKKNIQTTKQVPRKQKQTTQEVKIIKNLPQQIKPKKLRAIPKLAIIIDDVIIKAQIKKIKKIPYPVTMAFLPPTLRHKNSAKISKDFTTYMIHLPLEAKSRRLEENNTLHVGDSINKIEQRIKKLKKLYPYATYINNHTGSKFTSDHDSMNKLLKILKKYNYSFLDSRTTSKTVGKKYASKHNVKYLARNIFLDNKQDKRYIQKQLRKAVRVAKRDGYAIAIGHPHSITLKTLAQSKYLLGGLNIVFIDKL